jgi:hypothetical protein
MSRQRAFQLIDIADFCDALGLTIEEASESALRPLVPLSKRNRAAAQRALDRATERAGGLQNLTRPLVERALAEEEGRAVPTECPRVDTATMHKLVQTGFSRLQCPGDSLREFHKGLQCLVAVVIEVARRELDRAHWLKDEHPNAFAQQCHDLGVEPERLLKEIEWLSTWLPEHHAPLLPASAKEKHSR